MIGTLKSATFAAGKAALVGLKPDGIAAVPRSDCSTEAFPQKMQGWAKEMYLRSTLQHEIAYRLENRHFGI